MFATEMFTMTCVPSIEEGEEAKNNTPEYPVIQIE
jgi:hypothetical protein